GDQKWILSIFLQFCQLLPADFLQLVNILFLLLCQRIHSLILYIFGSYTFLSISRTLYSITPEGISTFTISPFFAPIRALPTGDSLEILPSRLFASVDPTILNSISSSNS